MPSRPRTRPFAAATAASPSATSSTRSRRSATPRRSRTEPSARARPRPSRRVPGGQLAPAGRNRRVVDRGPAPRGHRRTGTGVGQHHLAGLGTAESAGRLRAKADGAVPGGAGRRSCCDRHPAPRPGRVHRARPRRRGRARRRLRPQPGTRALRDADRERRALRREPRAASARRHDRRGRGRLPLVRRARLPVPSTGQLRHALNGQAKGQRREEAGQLAKAMVARGVREAAPSPGSTTSPSRAQGAGRRRSPSPPAHRRSRGPAPARGRRAPRRSGARPTGRSPAISHRASAAGRGSRSTAIPTWPS